MIRLNGQKAPTRLGVSGIGLAAAILMLAGCAGSDSSTRASKSSGTTKSASSAKSTRGKADTYSELRRQATEQRAGGQRAQTDTSRQESIDVPSRMGTSGTSATGKQAGMGRQESPDLPSSMGTSATGKQAERGHQESPDVPPRMGTAGTSGETAAGARDTVESKAISQPTEAHIPGNRIIEGKVTAVRGNQIAVDIGTPQPVWLPAKPASEKDIAFKEGDPIIVTMNDHNAVVDYHHPGDGQGGVKQSAHDVIRGQLAEPLTIGFDKAVIRTEDGSERGYWIASRARAKLGAIPTGADAVFLRDETGQIVDAQLTSDVSQNAASHEKGRIKGAHRQVQAVFKGTEADDRIKVALPPGDKERVMPIRQPLQKLDRLKEDQNVVLLVDEEGYVVEIATPDVAPVR